MAKKNVQPANEEVEVVAPVEEQKASKKGTQKNVKEKDTKNSKAKNKSKKEKKSLKRKVNEVISELKKVSKPTFGKVVKNTCVVILIVSICTLLLFGMDKLFSLIYNLLLP